MASEKILNDGLRKQFTTELMELLRQSGYDVMQVGTNELCIPCVDAERNDKYVTFTIKVPTGERGGDPYDGYSMAEDFALKCKAKEEKAKEKTEKALFNIHLDLGALHYVEDGKIKEANTMNASTLIIGDDVFRNVGGKMLRALARTRGGFIAEEVRATYSAVMRNDGAYGTTALNSTTTKTFLYNENAINPYNGYLLTDVYADLHAMKDDSENLPVRKTLYMIIGLEQIPAERKSVISLEGLDKKALKAFLKAEKIDWSELEDLVKVIDYITANRK